MKSLLLGYLALVMLLAFAPLHAAENPDADDEEQQTEEGDGQATEEDGGQSAEQQPSPTDQRIEETDSEEEGQQRFIPTEEISLDLGVSFPADI